jgi:hypothetical protein
MELGSPRDFSEMQGWKMWKFLEACLEIVKAPARTRPFSASLLARQSDDDNNHFLSSINMLSKDPTCLAGLLALSLEHM